MVTAELWSRRHRARPRGGPRDHDLLWRRRPSRAGERRIAAPSPSPTVRPRDPRGRPPSPRSRHAGDLRGGHAASLETGAAGAGSGWSIRSMGPRNSSSAGTSSRSTSALIEDGEPVLGVVLAPALDLLYWAVKGGGAWREARAPAGRADLLRARRRPARRSSSSRACRTLRPSWRSISQTIPVARRVKAGSSLKFCWVADGRADLYPRLGPTMEWDVAAGDCIYRQSGRRR